MKTMLLSTDQWDLTLDASGNIAVVDTPYAIAQDVASAARVFIGELWYATDLGIPYFSQVLGKPPALGFLSAQMSAAGQTVPEVVKVQTALDPLGPTRELTGKLTITDTRGQTIVVSSGVSRPWYVFGGDAAAAGE